MCRLLENLVIIIIFPFLFSFHSFHSFLNSCVNPVALYCVSGAFRAHFNQYLCCWCVKRQTRIRQHSTATGMMDTSIVNMSMRSTNHYNRASVHLNNANSCAGANGTNGTGTGRLPSGYRRQSSLHVHSTPQAHHHKNGDGRLSSSVANQQTQSMVQSGVILSGDKRWGTMTVVLQTDTVL